jgi:hypothetical protein
MSNKFFSTFLIIAKGLSQASVLHQQLLAAMKACSSVPWPPFSSASAL